MAGIISLYRRNDHGVLEADPDKVKEHFKSNFTQLLTDLKNGEESRAQRLFEATIASPVFAEFIDGEAVRDFASVLYSFNYVKGKKVEALVDQVKSCIPGFSFSLPESSKRGSPVEGVASPPPYRLEDFVKKVDEVDAEMAAAIAASLREASTDGKAPA